MTTAPILSLVTPAQQSKSKPKKSSKADNGPPKPLIESQPPGSKLAVGRRMYLYTGLKGERTWKWMYRLFDPAKGKDRQFEIKLGVWPAMSYQDADAARAKAWSEYVDKKLHPPQYKTVKAKAKADLAKEAQAETVSEMVEAWIKENKAEWVPSYALQVATYMERYFGPTMDIGCVPFAKVTRNEIVVHLKGIRDGLLKTWDKETQKYVPMDQGTPSVARIAKTWINAAFEQACDDGLLTVNPIANVRTKKKKKSEAATVNSPVMSGNTLHRLLDGIDNYGGDRRTKLLLLLLCHTCVRSSELRCASWLEFDLNPNIAEWIIPASRMKMKRMHKVPLSRQALALLGQLQHVSGTKGLLFPNENDPNLPMPQSSAREAMYRLTGKAYSPHSFRSTFSTLGNEGEVAEPHVIDAVLAHRKDSGTAEGHYNQATYFAGRTKLMQAWSDYLDALVTGPTMSI
ncbi:MAG TPA: tyrosine-type recombinase/integrase [Paraburkholderia sp.]|nr:tyrosine-type recombinase/integrase [Paraburkholderia sp.]